VSLELPENYKEYTDSLGKDPTPALCLWGPVPRAPEWEPNLTSVISHRCSLDPGGLSEARAVRQLCPLSDGLRAEELESVFFTEFLSLSKDQGCLLNCLFRKKWH